MIQVSVLVLTYNSDPNKLLKTLRGIVAQKNVCFEIVVSDDGSPKENHCALIERFFQEVGFRQYQLVMNPVNKGTIQNFISAIAAASGEYVYSTSPGDVLFDSNTLADFYAFAKRRNLKLCFGNPVHYAMLADKPTKVKEYGTLKKPSLYQEGRMLPMVRAAFMQGAFPVGAAFFRERTAALEWLRAAAKTAVYAEDCTSTAYALAEKTPLIHYDRNIVWYEDGTGISTSGSDVWTERILKDWRETVFCLHTLYPRDPYVDLAYMSISIPSGKKRKLIKFLKHPLATICGKLNDKISVPQKTQCTLEDLVRLEQI